MPRKSIQETVDRITHLMEHNVSAKTYLELSTDDNNESMQLVARIDEIADAMTTYRMKDLPEKEKELYEFVETITEDDIALFKRYCAWFRRIGRKKPK
jgi:hypothetical protein